MSGKGFIWILIIASLRQYSVFCEIFFQDGLNLLLPGLLGCSLSATINSSSNGGAILAVLGVGYAGCFLVSQDPFTGCFKNPALQTYIAALGTGFVGCELLFSESPSVTTTTTPTTTTVGMCPDLQTAQELTGLMFTLSSTDRSPGAMVTVTCDNGMAVTVTCDSGTLQWTRLTAVVDACNNPFGK